MNAVRICWCDSYDTCRFIKTILVAKSIVFYAGDQPRALISTIGLKAERIIFIAVNYDAWPQSGYDSFTEAISNLKMNKNFQYVDLNIGRYGR